MADTPKPQSSVVCPRCGNYECDRIPRTRVVKLLFPKRMKHYACAKCMKRFYKSN